MNLFQISFISNCLFSDCYNKITIYQVGGLNENHLFLTVLEGKSKIIVFADPVFGERPLPGLYTATFSLYPHMIEREEARSLSLYEDANAIMTAPP